MTPREALDSLLDKDDHAMVHVITTAVLAMRDTSEQWQARSLPGSPSVTDYANAVRDRLRDRY